MTWKLISIHWSIQGLHYRSEPAVSFNSCTCCISPQSPANNFFCHLLEVYYSFNGVLVKRKIQRVQTWARCVVLAVSMLRWLEVLCRATWSYDSVCSVWNEATWGCMCRHLSFGFLCCNVCFLKGSCVCSMNSFVITGPYCLHLYYSTLLQALPLLYTIAGTCTTFHYWWRFLYITILLLVTPSL